MGVRRNLVRLSPFGAYTHWCALLCGLGEAALEHELLSTRQLRAIRQDLEASLAWAARISPLPVEIPDRWTTAISPICFVMMRCSAVFAVFTTPSVKRFARSKCLKSSTCWIYERPTGGCRTAIAALTRI